MLTCRALHFEFGHYFGMLGTVQAVVGVKPDCDDPEHGDQRAKQQPQAGDNFRIYVSGCLNRLALRPTDDVQARPRQSIRQVLTLLWRKTTKQKKTCLPGAARF